MVPFRLHFEYVNFAGKQPVVYRWECPHGGERSLFALGADSRVHTATIECLNGTGGGTRIVATFEQSHVEELVVVNEGIPSV